MVADILKTTLEAVDAECEAAARPAVDSLYNEARYDGLRFCVPSFQAAGAVWLRLIAEKERRFVVEISRVLSTPGAILSTEGSSKVQELIEAIFSDVKYLGRLKGFSESVTRRAASYGITLDISTYRFDIADSAYRVGVVNAVSRARRRVQAEVALRNQLNVPDSVQRVSRWWRYLRAHPWKALVALMLLGLVPWLISRANLADIYSWIRAQ